MQIWPPPLLMQAILAWQDVNDNDVDRLLTRAGILLHTDCRC